MAAAMRTRGTAVCAGILCTKLVGVALLALSQTRIFQVYYFRMYLALVLLGALHGFLLLPVLLSLVGPPQLPGVVVQLARRAPSMPWVRPCLPRPPPVCSFWTFRNQTFE